MKPSRQVARDIPVFAVVPPNVLLLDVAGPMEVLRKANLEQQSVRFVTTYVGPASVVGSSIGLSVAGIAPLPERLPDGAFVLLSGSVAVPMAASAAAVGDVAETRRASVDRRRVNLLGSAAGGARRAAGRQGVHDAPRRDRRTEKAGAAGARRGEPAVRD
jgi:transcriptional regulator GlxA family with amidase domain